MFGLVAWRNIKQEDPALKLGRMVWHLTLIRIYIGFDLVPHFTEKLFAGPGPRDEDIKAFIGLGVPAPEFFVTLAGLCELGIAIGIGLGLLTRLAAVCSAAYFMIVRQYYFLFSALGILSLFVVPQFWSSYAWAALLIVPYVLVGCYDLFISRSNVLRNYPVIGHLRYGLEFISPEIRQYFVETEHSGRPFNREQREMVYRRAEGKPDFQPFGTQYDVEDVGYRTAEHSLAPKVVPESEARVDVGGPDCKQIYNASRLNISAMINVENV